MSASRGRTWTRALSPACGELFDDAIATLRGLGAEVRDITLPHFRHTWTALGAIIRTEQAAAHATLIRSRRHLYGKSLGDRIAGAMLRPAVQYIEAQRLRTLIKRDFDAALEKVDVIATPTIPIWPYRIDANVSGGAGEGALTTKFTHALEPHRPARDLRALRLRPRRRRRRGSPRRPPTRRTGFRGGAALPCRPRLRAGHRVAHYAPAALVAAGSGATMAPFGAGHLGLLTRRRYGLPFDGARGRLSRRNPRLARRDASAELAAHRRQRYRRRGARGVRARLRAQGGGQGLPRRRLA